MAAVMEQNMTTEADTPGAVRGVHRADARVFEDDGRRLWVDVKVAESHVQNALCQAEVAKVRTVRPRTP